MHPLIPVPCLVLFGVCIGILTSSHASIETVAQNYVCCIMMVLIPGLLYNLWILKRLEADEVAATEKKKAAELEALRAQFMSRKN
jgi:hypothetical protein